MTEADWLGGADPAPLLRFAADRLTDRRQLLFMAGCCRRVWDLLTDPRFRRVVGAAEDVADVEATEEALTAAAEELPPPGGRVPGPPPLELPISVNWLTGRGPPVHIGPIGDGGGHQGGVVNFRDLPVWCQQAYHAVAAIAPRRFLMAAEACENAAARFAEERVADSHPLHEEIRRLRDEVRQLRDRAEDYRRRGISGSHEEAAAAARAIERETDKQVRKLSNEIWSAGGEERMDRARAERAAQTELVRCLIENPFRPAEVDPAWLTSTVVALAGGIYAERAFDRLPILADALQDAGCDSDTVLSHCRDGGAHARGCWVVDRILGR
jgi:hypothetical protein